MITHALIVGTFLYIPKLQKSSFIKYCNFSNYESNMACTGHNVLIFVARYHNLNIKLSFGFTTVCAGYLLQNQRA
jgi:hypothetical protein